jgi:hypothetical protein
MMVMNDDKELRKNCLYINGFLLWDKEEPAQPAACHYSLYSPPTTNGARDKQTNVDKCTILMFSNSDIGTM